MITDSICPWKLKNAGKAAKNARGFSLVEVLVAATMLSVSVVGIYMLLTAGIKQQDLAGKYMLATNLGQDLLDEITGKPFRDPETPEDLRPGPESGESGRQAFDNIDDYDGLVEAAGNMQLPDGTTLDSPRLVSFSRTASAEYVYLDEQDPTTDPTFILITVEVQHDSVPMAELKYLISSAESQAY